MGIVALLFTALGVWVGHRLTRRTVPGPFEKNRRVIATVGLLIALISAAVLRNSKVLPARG